MSFSHFYNSSKLKETTSFSRVGFLNKSIYLDKVIVAETKFRVLKRKEGNSNFGGLRVLDSNQCRPTSKGQILRVG